MGYCHYWRIPKKFPAKKFKEFSADVKKIIDYCHKDLGIHIADGMGEGEPTCNESLIRFNGSSTQPKGVWTTNEQISIPWPSPTASLKEISADPIAEKTEGHWFAGDLVSQRVAPTHPDNPEFADGSYETFSIERQGRVGEYEVPNEKGLFFDCCKTAYRPYDLAVTAVLIALKHHFPKCQVSSDGEDKDWLDGKFLCNNLLGYGMDFELED